MPKRAAAADALTLVRSHQKEVWRYLRYLGCSAADAEDLTQETFLAVLRQPFEDRGPLSSAAYLRRVASRLHLKSLRRNSRQPLFVDLERAEAVWVELCARDGGDRYAEALRLCLEELGGRGQMVVRLRYEKGQSRGQIAEAMGLGLDGVKSLLRRIRKTLRSCVERRIER